MPHRAEGRHGLTALLGGLGAALGWALATLLAARSARAIGVTSTLTWVMVTGLVVAVPVAAAAGTSADLDAAAFAWLALAGVGNVAGLILVYAAVQRGRVGVVSAIVSTEGALAALGAVLTGERPSHLMYLAFGVVTAGVVLVAAGSGGGSGGDASARAPVGPSVALGACAALMFAASLLAIGQASQAVPAAWTTLPARLVGVAIVLAALAGGVRPVAPGRRTRVAGASGVMEVVGILCFALGARDQVSVTAVIASQFAVLTAVGAYLAFRETLTRRQVTGVAITALGVALVASQVA